MNATENMMAGDFRGGMDFDINNIFGFGPLI